MIYIVLWGIIAIILNKVYHHKYNVLYFGANGVIREMIATIVVSGIITGIILGIVHEFIL